MRDRTMLNRLFSRLLLLSLVGVLCLPAAFDVDAYDGAATEARAACDSVAKADDVRVAAPAAVDAFDRAMPAVYAPDTADRAASFTNPDKPDAPMPLYDVAAHALLSAEAAAVRGPDAGTPSAEFSALNAAAELELNLDAYTFDAEDADVVRLVVVYQVNHMVAYGPDVDVYSTQGIAGAYKTARAGVPSVSPKASSLLARLAGTEASVAEGFAILRTLR